jgi:hypothetical protein
MEIRTDYSDQTQVTKLWRWFHKSDRKRDSRRLEASQDERECWLMSLCSAMDSSKPKEGTRLQHLLPKSTALWRAPRQREECGLGTEGWLGLMIFLGIVLGLVYARLTLP